MMLMMYTHGGAVQQMMLIKVLVKPWFDLIPKLNSAHHTRHSHEIPLINITHNYFKTSFSSSAISEWKKLDLNIRNLSSLNIFRKNLLVFKRTTAYSFFLIHNPYGIKLTTGLRLGFSNLHENVFRHCFQDSLICDWTTDIETATRFFLHRPSFHTPGGSTLNNMRRVNEQIYLKTKFVDSNVYVW